jgi:cytochrome c553
MSIGTLVFVLAFVFVGLAVVLAALRGGRRADGKQSPATRRAIDRAWIIVMPLAVLVVGIGIPAAVMLDNAESQTKDGPGGIELTDSQVEAQKVFALRCGNCHTLAASNSVGRVGPNLDTLRPPKALVLNAIQQGRARGQGQMPANIVSGQEAEAVADYVATVAGR